MPFLPGILVGVYAMPHPAGTIRVFFIIDEIPVRPTIDVLGPLDEHSAQFPSNPLGQKWLILPITGRYRLFGTGIAQTANNHGILGVHPHSEGDTLTSSVQVLFDSTIEK
jgi:hypothetical protein